MRKGILDKNISSNRWSKFVKNNNTEKTSRKLDHQQVYIANTHLYSENTNDIVLNQELFADEPDNQYFKITEVSKKQSWIVKLVKDKNGENNNYQNIKNMQ